MNAPGRIFAPAFWRDGDGYRQSMAVDNLVDMIDEVVRFKTKPNALLYALEASRYYFVVTLAMSFALMPVAHFKTGLPIYGLMLPIVLTVYGALLSTFFVLVVFVARCVEFIVTNERVIVRVSLMKRMNDNVSIPIKSIRRIEVRSYNARYGSVYFKCNEASPLDDMKSCDGSRSQISDHSRPPSFDPPVDGSRRLANLVVRSDWGAIWLSMPSSPPLSGFYGFRHFDTFAKLVADLQAAA
jgi:hypothetical protein